MPGASASSVTLFDNRVTLFEHGGQEWGAHTIALQRLAGPGFFIDISNPSQRLHPQSDASERPDCAILCSRDSTFRPA
jgi:hypothetical protein